MDEHPEEAQAQESVHQELTFDEVFNARSGHPKHPVLSLTKQKESE
jgi:hypothetical protein